MSLSIVIPVGPKDSSYKKLLGYLSQFSKDVEIIFCGDIEKEIIEEKLEVSKLVLDTEISSRASQQNKGAELASGNWILFLHCDSCFDRNYVNRVEDISNSTEDSLYYGKLHFYDGSFLTNLNAIGANVRSRFFNIPFGDQSFLIKKDAFFRYGPYDPKTIYGEDHDFIWKLKKQNYNIRPLGQTLESSSRKYDQTGWFKLSCKYFYLTWKKVLIEIFSKE